MFSTTPSIRMAACVRKENSNFQQHDNVTHWWNNYVKMPKLNHVFSIDSRIIEMSSLLDSIGFICPNARRHPPTHKTTTTTMPSSIMWKWEISSESIFSKQQNLHFRMRRQQMLNGFLHEWFKNWMGVLSAYGTCVRFIFGTDFAVMFCKSPAIDGFLVMDRLCWKLSERAKALSSVAHVKERGGYWTAVSRLPFGVDCRQTAEMSCERVWTSVLHETNLNKVPLC